MENEKVNEYPANSILGADISRLTGEFLRTCPKVDRHEPKIIYDAEFEAEAEDDGYGYPCLWLSDPDEKINVVYNYINKSLYIKTGKKYKVTLKIEEVE